jgi:hypothetical protein
MMSPTRRPCRADVSGRHDTMSSNQLRTTFKMAAKEVDTNQLRHILWEDVGSLHIRLVKEKHSHITDVAFGRIAE